MREFPGTGVVEGIGTGDLERLRGAGTYTGISKSDLSSSGDYSGISAVGDLLWLHR